MAEYIPGEEASAYIRQMYGVVLATTGLGAESCILVGGTPRDIVLDRLDPAVADVDFLGPFDFGRIIHQVPERVEAHWPKYRTLKLRLGPTLLDLTYCEPEEFEATIGEYDLNISKLTGRPDGTIGDPFGVLDSIRAGIITADAPEKRIVHDPSRILRIARFAAQLNFSIDVELYAAMRAYSNRIPHTDHRDDLEKILSLPESTRSVALQILDDSQSTVHRVTLLETLSSRVEALEAKVLKNSPVLEIQKILHDVPTVYLVGGATRDAIRDFPPKDFDFKALCSTESLVERFVALGFELSEDYNITEGQFYVNAKNGCVSIVINGKDIDIAPIETSDVPELIKSGDINLNCCVFDVKSHRFVNTDLVSEVEEGKLRFCDNERAVSDPLIIVNALKHISRDPSITPTEEALEIIYDSIAMLGEFFQSNPDLMYKLHSLGGNVNTREVVMQINASKAPPEIKQWIINELKNVPLRKYEVRGFTRLEEPDADAKREIEDFVGERYGQHVDSKKLAELFTGEQSLYIKRGEGGNIIAVFSLEGSRVYTTAAISAEQYRSMLISIRHDVPYPWASVDIENQKIQALVTSAGFHQISNPFIASKLLADDQKTVQESLFGVVASNSTKRQILYGK